MTVISRKVITRQEIWKNRNRLFLYPDNILRRGYRGWARHCRGETNAVGIVTRRSPPVGEAHSEPEMLFADRDLVNFQSANAEAFARVRKFLKRKGIVIVPREEFEAEMVYLRQSAPVLADYLGSELAGLYGTP